MRLASVIVSLLAGAALGAPRPPAWVEQTAKADAQYVYAVGQGGPAQTQAEAEKAAVRDALDKLAQQIEVQVSNRTISVQSTKGSEVISDTRQAVRSRIRGAEPASPAWTQVQSRGMFPFRRRAFLSHVLLRLPRTEFETERQRQTSVAADFRQKIEGLAHDCLKAIGKQAEAVAVGGFSETTSGRRYTLSTILEKDLADALVREGLSVVPVGQAKTLVTGGYRAQGTEVVVTARVRHAVSRQQVAAVDAVFDKDALEPSWLEISQPIEPFFEALEPTRAETGVRFGALSIDSRPQGARVFVDGEDRGRTPVDLREVPVGRRAVTLLLDQHEPFTAQVQVSEGESAPIDAALSPKTGALEVRSVPTGAEVLIQGRAQGRTPLTLKDLRVGPYTLVLRLLDHDETQFLAIVQHRQTTRAEIELVEQPGSLFVISDPPGATILVDGVEVGKASAPNFLKINGVRAGVRQVEALIPGVGSWHGTSHVRAKQMSQITAKIEDRRGTLLLSAIPAQAEVFVDSQNLAVATAEKGRRNGIQASQKAAPPVIDEEEILRSIRQRLMSGDSPDAEIPAPSHTWTIPLTEGRHEIQVRAPGYRSKKTSVNIRLGEIKKLSVSLKKGKSPSTTCGNHRPSGSIMPWTTAFFDECSQENSLGTTLLNCGAGFVLAETITLGFYPLGTDLLALPFRAVARSYNYLTRQECVQAIDTHERH